MGDTEVITLSEAARRLAVHRTLVQYLIREHQIPCHQVGSAKVLRAGEFARLRRAVAAHRAKPDPAAIAV